MGCVCVCALPTGVEEGTRGEGEEGKAEKTKVRDLRGDCGGETCACMCASNFLHPSPSALPIDTLFSLLYTSHAPMRQCSARLSVTHIYIYIYMVALAQVRVKACVCVSLRRCATAQALGPNRQHDCAGRETRTRAIGGESEGGDHDT